MRNGESARAASAHLLRHRRRSPECRLASRVSIALFLFVGVLVGLTYWNGPFPSGRADAATFYHWSQKTAIGRGIVT